MFSRAGKSTTSQYLAFQDPEKLADIQSKVANYMGKLQVDTSNIPKKSPAEELKAAMDPKQALKKSDKEFAKLIFEQGWKAQPPKGQGGDEKEEQKRKQRLLELERQF